MVTREAEISNTEFINNKAVFGGGAQPCGCLYVSLC
jgi:hypothetical protein